MYPYQLDCYERAVRSQDHHQDTDIINYYVQLGLQLAQQCETASATKRVYFRLISTLEETMCDPLLCEYWRAHCLRVIKRLTPIIFELVSDKEYASMMTKITVLAAYFLPTKSPQSASGLSVNKNMNRGTTKSRKRARD